MGQVLPVGRTLMQFPCYPRGAHQHARWSFLLGWLRGFGVPPPTPPPFSLTQTGEQTALVHCGSSRLGRPGDGSQRWSNGLVLVSVRSPVPGRLEGLLSGPLRPGGGCQGTGSGLLGSRPISSPSVNPLGSKRFGPSIQIIFCKASG